MKGPFKKINCNNRRSQDGSEIRAKIAGIRDDL
jgi:hypothetical protein